VTWYTKSNNPCHGLLVYLANRSTTNPPQDKALRPGAVARTVILLGVTSLLTDVSQEMVTAILPLYLVLQLGLSPLSFGVVDGVNQSSAALARLLGGALADRLGRYKEVAAAGYGLSALTKLGFLLVGTYTPGLTLVMLLDRLGKGIRTAPRDAMIALSSHPKALGRAFGVHRTLDTAGAMLGPLVAYGLLQLVPRRYDATFVVSFMFALLGLATLVTFVKNPNVKQSTAAQAPQSFRVLWAERRSRALLALAFALGTVTLSDGFIYLALQKQLAFEPGLVPLLYVATPGVYMLLAAPLGRLADRMGRAKLLVVGYACLGLVYLVLLSHAPWAWLVCILLLGTYYAGTDGVLVALASRHLPSELTATGLAGLATANQVGRLGASLLFGWLWTAGALPDAILVFLVAIALLLGACTIGLHRLGLGRD